VDAKTASYYFFTQESPNDEDSVAGAAAGRQKDGVDVTNSLPTSPTSFQTTTATTTSTHRHSLKQPALGGYAHSLRPEFFKAVVAMAYLFVVTWITALVMVIVHDRVPDMEKYPPLPDLFLDNMPHIPWAFEMCEVTGTILFTLWIGVLTFHKHRFILIRRFFALSGTVFLLRSVIFSRSMTFDWWKIG